MRVTVKGLLYIGLVALTAAGSLTVASADEKGNKALREAFKQLGASKAMTATLTVKIEGDAVGDPFTLKGNVWAMKPNFFRFDYKGEMKREDEKIPVEAVYVADGKDYYTLGGLTLQFNMKRYRKDKLAEKPTELLGEWEGEVDAFFGGEKNVEKGDAALAGTEKINGVTCDIIKFTQKAAGEAPERLITYYVGQKDKLIHRASYDITPGLTQTNTLSDINLKADKKAEDFKFTPPKDAEEIKPPRRRDLTLAPGRTARLKTRVALR